MTGGLRLTQTLHRQAMLHPGRGALADEGGTCSYDQCLDGVARLAGGLVDAGLQAGERVAVLAFNSAPHVQLFYAITWAGGIAVPLNWRWAGPELTRAMSNCEAAMLITDRDHGDDGRWAASSSPGVRAIIPLETLDGNAIEDRSASGAATALITCCPGDDAVPDTVSFSHEWLTARAARDPVAGAPEPSTQLLMTPLFEPAALMWAFNALAHGHKLVVSGRSDIAEVAALVRREKITDIALTSFMLRSLIRDSAYDPDDFQSLERLHIQASALSMGEARIISRKLPDIHWIEDAARS